MQKRKWLAQAIRNRDISPERQSERTVILQRTRIDRAQKEQKLLITFYCLIVILVYFCFFFVNHPSGLFNTFSVCHWFHGVPVCHGSFLFFPFSCRSSFLLWFLLFLDKHFRKLPRCLLSRHVAFTAGTCVDEILVCMFLKWVSFTQTHKAHAFIEYVESGWIALGVVNWLIEFNLVRRLPCIAIRELVIRTQCTTTQSPLNIF